MKAEVRNGVQGLEDKIAEHRTMLDSVQDRVQKTDDRTKLLQVASQERLISTCAQFERMDRSIVRIRHLGEQIVDYLNTFPRKIQGYLRAILQSNLQMYQLMLQIQQNISSRPTHLLESDIRFEDALGETKQLPYEYFRHWEVGSYALISYK